jgi:hypothetical protein
MNDLPPDFIARCKAVTAKRPRTVIEHILAHGYITTEELKEKYGYNHLRPTEETNHGTPEGDPGIHQGDPREARMSASHPLSRRPQD